MTFPLSSRAIEETFFSACLAELSALKPGNVHIHSPGHGMEVHHFENAARAAAPWVADTALAPGARILKAVEASFAVANCNTNLGILLLCVPLAVAAGQVSGSQPLRERLASVLQKLDHDDTTNVFRAIAHANPAGLGEVDEGDVASEASMTLGRAMALAQDRDRIARAYVSDFQDIFTFGLPRLQAARKSAASEDGAITALHLSFLATFLDSHISRKHGLETADYVRLEARKRAHLSHPDDAALLLAFDRALKERGLNPGTTADFVVGTLYADKLIAQSATESPA